MNKPKGYITAASDPTGKSNVMELLAKQLGGLDKFPDAQEWSEEVEEKGTSSTQPLKRC